MKMIESEKSNMLKSTISSSSYSEDNIYSNEETIKKRSQNTFWQLRFTRSKYFIIAIIIVLFILIEFLLPPPKHVYQNYELEDYARKSFEHKPSDLIYESNAFSFIDKYEKKG